MPLPGRGQLELDERRAALILLVHDMPPKWFHRVRT
jgi:hypothetical protein